jgi:hypothetical protein
MLQRHGGNADVAGGAIATVGLIGIAKTVTDQGCAMDNPVVSLSARVVGIPIERIAANETIRQKRCPSKSFAIYAWCRWGRPPKQ